MSDRRLTPANGRVAATHLRGFIDSETYAEGTQRQVRLSIVDLQRTPNGPRDRQLVMGDSVTVYDEMDGHRFVQSNKDSYVGYVPSNTLGSPNEPTHWVAVPSGHAYPEPDMKSRELHPLYFGSQVTVTSHMPKFFETSDGHYIPKPHLRPIDKRFKDPVTVAQMLFGAPYLWGGNTVAGIDCSGLVQAACLACDIACLGDSDLQENSLGTEIAPDTPMQRGDLLFWAGHVALAVDDSTLIHANAHHMAVAYEPADHAIKRIAAQGDGPVTTRRRLFNRAD